MSDYRETILKLDRADAYQELYDFVRLQPVQVDQLVIAAVLMLRARRIHGAYMIAKMLENRSYNPVLAFAQAVGGFARDVPDDEQNGRRLLQAQVDALPPTERSKFYFEFEPLMRTLVGNAFGMDGGMAKVVRLLALLKAFTPALREVFDTDAPAVPYDQETIRARGLRSARLVGGAETSTFAGPPRRVLIAMRARVFPQDPASRAFEVSPLLAEAMTDYGWKVELFAMEWFQHMSEDFSRLSEACRTYRPDLLILDEQVVQVGEAHAPRAGLIAALRKATPGAKVVGLHLDPWSIDARALATTAEDVDVVWTFAPDLPAWRDPVFAGKVFKAPLPYPVMTPAHPVGAMHLAFQGSIASYNWHRWLWLAAAQQFGVPVATGFTKHKTDNLPPMDSFRAYLGSLSRAGAVLNFGMRSDLSIALTGRTFEVLAAGALLVQERTPELDNFLVAGEHYLPFTSFADLRAIARYVAEAPAGAAEVRRRGHDFFRDHYAPRRIIQTLDRRLG